MTTLYNIIYIYTRIYFLSFSVAWHGLQLFCHFLVILHVSKHCIPCKNFRISWILANSMVQRLPLVSFLWCRGHFGLDIYWQHRLRNKVKLLENHPTNTCSIVFLVQSIEEGSRKQKSLACAHFRHKIHRCFMLVFHSFDRKIIGHKTHTYKHHNCIHHFVTSDMIPSFAAQAS